MFYQGSLFGTLAPEFDASFTEAERLDLDHTTWVELVPGWLRGADEVFDELRRKMAAPRPAPARWEKIAR